MSTPLVLEPEKIKEKDISINGHFRFPTFKDVSNNGNEQHSFRDQTDHGKRVSIEEYWEHYYEHPTYTYEYNFGILEVKGMAKFTDVFMHGWFLDLIRWFKRYANDIEAQELEKRDPTDEYPGTQYTYLEIGFIVDRHEDGEMKVRIPDIGLISADNEVRIKGDDRRYKGIYDICIEMVSDSSWSEVERDVEIKLKEYEAAGVQEYYIIAIEKEWVAFYQRNEQGKFEKVEAEIIRSKSLPGFQFRVQDLWNQPTLEEMAFDEIYRDFVMLEYQQERQRAEQERLEKEKEHQRADAAEARELAERQAKEEAQARELAERQLREKAEEKTQKILAKLRELGGDIDEL